LTQVDSAQHQLITTSFSFGVTGPAALGKEIQTGIHRWLKNPLPHGWQYQVHNDIIINYQLNYEKQCLHVANNFLVNVTGEARLGTLNTKLSSGFNFMAGRFNHRFLSFTHKRRKAEYYFFGQGRLHFIGYDASLQGGLFNRTSPYHISSSDISRVVFQADGGMIVNLRKLFLSYTQSFLSKEFRTGTYHRWGGVSIGFAL
jgi:lipid A 3-O-deacylase